MRKMISILTLCLVTGFTMTSPVAASTVQSCTQTTDNVNIIQSGLSDANLCLNQNALLLNGVYVNGSCMKLQPKCNSAVVNSYILQQVSKNNALCKNNVQQQNCPVNGTSAATAKVTSGIPAATAPSSVVATKAAANTQTTACPKTGTQTTTTTKTGTVTKQTQPSGTTTSTKPATGTTNPVNSADNNTSTSSFREFQKQVIALVNKERAAAGLSALTENTALDNTATLKSEDMVKLNYFSHTSPTYGSPFQMMTQLH
jgi:uncharacterized protein YkwD